MFGDVRYWSAFAILSGRRLSLLNWKYLNESNLARHGQGSIGDGSSSQPNSWATFRSDARRRRGNEHTEC
jgi:hypothetical protein